MGKKLSKFFTEGSKFSRVTNRHLASKFAISSPSDLATKSAPPVSREARVGRSGNSPRMPRRCTPRNKRRRPPSPLSRKAASATAVARAPHADLVDFDEKFAISSHRQIRLKREIVGKSNGRLRVQKFDEKFAKFPPRWPKGLFICSCACLDELASTSAFPTRAPTVDQQPTNGSLGEYLYQLRTSGPGKGTPIESVFWKFV